MERVVEQFTELLDNLPELSVRAVEAQLEELVGEAAESYNTLVDTNRRLASALQAARLENLDAVSPKEATKLRTDLSSLQAHRERDAARIKDLEKALKGLPELEKRNKAVAKKNREMQAKVATLNEALAANRKARQGMSESLRMAEGNLIAHAYHPIWESEDSIEVLIQWPRHLVLDAADLDQKQHPKSPTLLFLNRVGVAAICTLSESGDILVAQSSEKVSPPEEVEDVMLKYLRGYCEHQVPSKKEWALAKENRGMGPFLVNGKSMTYERGSHTPT